MTKRGISFLLVLIMVLSMIPMGAFAAQEEDHKSADTEVFVDEDVLETVRDAAQAVAQDNAESEAEPEEQPQQEAVSQRPGKKQQTVEENHTHKLVASERIPPLCEDEGLSAGVVCSECGEIISGCKVIPALGHDIVQHDAKLPTFSRPGWEAYEDCSRCAYSTYVEIPQLETPPITDYETFVLSVFYMEEIANVYALENPGKDPLELIIKYIRTGVDRYNSGSWGIMAGYEDADFAAYVAEVEDMLNSEATSIDEMFCFTNLKDIRNFYLPNGELADLGHMFGTMDITYHNKFGINHADVGGWAGDLVDLLEFSDLGGVSGSLEEMVAAIGKDYFLVTPNLTVGGFSKQDLIGDLDAMYFMDLYKNNGYHYELEVSGLAIDLMMYFTETLSMEDRAEYFLRNRLNGVSTRGDVRDAVYNAYTTNKVIGTLEGTREFSSPDLDTLRKAVCYCYADYICKLAGDYVDQIGNDLYTVFSSETAVLAPGVTQQIKMATTADGKQIVYYLATGDLTREDVNVYANYHNNDPTQGWEMQRVLDQANAAQERHSDPDSEHYIENYNVIASVNGAGFNMQTGEPAGVLVMGGVEYSPISSSGFFGILKDGTPVIGTQEEYNTIYKGQVAEAISGFGSRLIKDGKIIEGLSDDRASRTAVGITKTGKVVFMVLDGRQEPFSAGGGYRTLAQILLEAGCVEAVNLDGGGSTTFVAKQPGDEELSVVNRPSDGFARSVSTSWMIVSTAPSSTAFDHAVLDSDYDYLTAGAAIQMSATGVSATGNTVALPEGAYWAVSDEACGSISAEGVFTGLAEGSVDVYLMVEDTVVGSKTLQVVTPTNLYFTKPNLDMVYGETKALPLKLLFNGKEVAYTTADVVFGLSNKKAGAVSGLSFTAAATETTGISSVTVTAALACDTSIAATMKVSLFRQGELTFDFDQATGGDRQLAWQRTVSNAEVEDAVYTVIDSTKDMVTSYILAIDMTQITIPKRLEDLTYMLPGSDIAGATAWTFLCQLAERISTLTEIKAVVHYDPNFELDISQLKLVNEYFQLNDVAVDEENCTLTLTLNWKKQTQAIKQDSANGMCIVNGLKLTPKADAQWDAKGQLNIVNTGAISYKVYMRASALYSFSSKPDNQAEYGLYAYENPADSYDRGGYFQDTYKEFNDSYTLVNQLKQGWYNEENGFAYYDQGVKYTGVRKVDGLYYNFGENGILAAKNVYTGLFLDVQSNLYRYAYMGNLSSGWYEIGGSWHYFEASTMAAANGKLRVDKILYEFEPTGKLVSGVWKNAFTGWRYYYGPSYVKKNWYEVDGQWYFFKDGCRVTGIQKVASQESVVNKLWYSFDENGVSQGKLTGFIEENGVLYYCEEGKPKEKGLFLFEGNYYFSKYDGSLITSQKYYAWKIDASCDLPKGHYEFDELGRLLGSQTEEQASGIVNKDGVLYYYENGKPKEKGLFCVDGAYYYAIYDGSLVTNEKYYAWKIDSSSALPKGHYEFGADGKMRNGICEVGGVLYYYENGKSVEKGLFCVDGAYYLAQGKGLLAVSQKVYAWKIDSSCTLAQDTYEFGADGKMLDGIVSKNGGLYYYEIGKPVEKGLFVYEGNHYFSQYGGVMVTGQKFYAWKTDSSSQLSVDHYEFDADGKVIGQSLTGEIVDKNGVLYYYEAGKPTEKGLFILDGCYYYSVYDGTLVVDQKYYAWKLDSSSELPVGHYEFAADGKILSGIVEKNGKLYFYENGKPAHKGFFKYEGNYYFAQYDGMLITDQKYYAWKLDASCDLPKDHYEFDSTGKMIDHFVKKNGVLYYYENGQPTEKGLFYLDGYYYFSQHDGSLITSQKYYVWKVEAGCDMPNGHYEFDENGRMLDGIVTKNGVLYYYENGAAVDKGLFYLDGHYYVTRYDGSLVTNCTYYVWKGNDLLVEKNYIFNELGQIIG